VPVIVGVALGGCVRAPLRPLPCSSFIEQDRDSVFPWSTLAAQSRTGCFVIGVVIEDVSNATT